MKRSEFGVVSPNGKTSWFAVNAVMSPDLEIRKATETEMKLIYQGIKDILPWWLSGSKSKAGLMIRYMLMLSKSELADDLVKLEARGVKVSSLVGEHDTITDVNAYQRKVPDVQILADLNHANLTLYPSIYVPLIVERLT